jgi:Family of unknown function (DUF6498)
MASGWIIGERVIRMLVALLFAGYNLIPLYGLWAWNWDAFQLLILYWSETVVLAVWAMVRIAFVPTYLLGIVTINGSPAKATHRLLIGGLATIAGVFCAAHLLFLCVIFSGDWFRRLHGIGDFLWTFYIVSDAWIALLAVTAAGGIDVLTGEYRPQFANVIARRLRMAPGRAMPPTTNDPVGSIIGGLLSRIVAMQVAIVCGAWVASHWGSLAPLSIIVGIKTLTDFSQRAPARADRHLPP